jgi:site-specific recombinase XerD
VTLSAAMKYKVLIPDSISEFMEYIVNRYKEEHSDNKQIVYCYDFLAIKNGSEQGRRMTKRAIQEMIKKYGRAYGKSELTTRYLRHSFGLHHVMASI